MKPAPALIAALLWASNSSPAPAQPAAPAAPRSDDVAAIKAVDDAFVKAFNAGDAGAVAATFTEDAEVTDEDGQAVEGREAIAAQFAALFAASPGVTITITTDAVKFLGVDSALVRGRSEVTPAGGGAADPARFTVVVVKRGGRWLQASVRDEHDESAPHADRLKALAWLVGDWVSESAEAVVATHCDWADNKSFLLRTFTVQVQGKPAMTGSQRIGWDPLTRQFRSWVFDSEGGFGEGTWSHQGGSWVVKAHGVRRDGRPASATQIVTPVNTDVIRWRSTERTLGGKSVADVDEFVLVRKPPRPR